MSKYIDRAALFNSLSGAKTVEEIFAAIQDAPAADVQEIRRGRWENDGHTLACSNCHTINIRGVAWDYCPHCGSQMVDVVSEDDTTER